MTKPKFVDIAAPTLAHCREELSKPSSELARRLASRTGVRADARFDARSGLYRIRVGAWPTRDEAEAAGKEMAERLDERYTIMPVRPNQ